MEKERQIAINELTESDYLLVIVKDREIKYRSKDKGIRAIVGLLNNKPELLQEAVVADKVIGRAVAMICDYAQVKFCYGSIISKSAIEILQKADLSYQFKKKVEEIRNKNDTGLCPVEKLTLKTDNSAEGIKMINDFLSDNC